MSDTLPVWKKRPPGQIIFSELRVLFAVFLAITVNCGAAEIQQVSAARAGPVSSLAFSRDGETIAVGAPPGIRLFKSSNGSRIRDIETGGLNVKSVCFSPDGRNIAAGLYNYITVWNVQNGELLKKAEGTFGRVSALDFGEGGEKLAAACQDGTARIYDAAELKEQWKTTVRGRPLTGISLSNDGKTLAVSAGGYIAVCDPGDPSSAVKLEGHRGNVLAFRMRKDKGRIVSIGSDRSLRFWDTASGKEICSLSDHNAGISSLAVGENWKLCATGYTEGTLILRDTDSGKPLHRIGDIKSRISAVALGPDSRRLACATAAFGKNLVLWRVDPEALINFGGIAIGSGEIEADYLDKYERGVVAELNMARTRPGEYVEFLKEHRKRFKDDKNYKGPGRGTVRTREGVKAVDEAIAYLEEVKPIGRLDPSKGLSLAAEDHAGDIGPKGIMGHTGSDGSTIKDRIERHGKWEKLIGENIAAGPIQPREIVMQLIIDDGVPGRGHRENIYNSKFGVIGVSIEKHKSYRNVCVMDFAGDFRDAR
ncbi:MAG: CAP domain-containing protein [Kiritimatiellia bacterium]